MSKAYANQLVKKYNAGRLSAAEELELEQYIEQGLIDIQELKDLQQLDEQLDAYFYDQRSRQMRENFQQVLEGEKQRLETAPPPGWIAYLRRWLAPSTGFNLAYGLLFLLIGTGFGYLLRGNGATSDNGEEIAVLTDELREMREMVMLSMLEKESTTERLKAVNLTQQMGTVSHQVTGALFKTLNNDPNANVRLAALEALTAYADNAAVREGLVESIGRQENPLVQVELAELMAELQEKQSVGELEKLLQRDETVPEVKQTIRNSLEILM